MQPHSKRKHHAYQLIRYFSFNEIYQEYGYNVNKQTQEPKMRTTNTKRASGSPLNPPPFSQNHFKENLTFPSFFTTLDTATFKTKNQQLCLFLLFHLANPEPNKTTLFTPL